MTTPLDRQLQRDLEPYVDRGIFLSAAKWTEAAAHALWISQEWQNEREFANARFDPANSGAAVQQVLAQHGIDAEGLAALPDAERDDRTFELNAQALSLVLTPQFQRDFLKRLKRFRQRLRAEQQADRLADASLVLVALETAQPVDQSVWAQCMLIYRLFGEALHTYLQLSENDEA